MKGIKISYQRPKTIDARKKGKEKQKKRNRVAADKGDWSSATVEKTENNTINPRLRGQYEIR